MSTSTFAVMAFYQDKTETKSTTVSEEKTPHKVAIVNMGYNLHLGSIIITCIINLLHSYNSLVWLSLLTQQMAINKTWFLFTLSPSHVHKGET